MPPLPHDQNAPPNGPPEPATLAEIYGEHANFVWRNLRRMGVAESLVDDAVQDVFLVVHRRLADFEARSQLKTWLFGIVLRVAQTYRRSARRLRARISEGEPELAEQGAAPESEGPLEHAARRQAVDLLHRLLDQIDDDKRAMLVLVELEEMSVPEAAEALGINLNTAYSRLRAARTLFESAVARHHRGHTP